MEDKVFELYSFSTPNGQKVGIALELMDLQYNAHIIDIRKGDQHTPEFKKLNPNEKIPVLVDPTGDHGQPLVLMESVAILQYLADHSGMFTPKDQVERYKLLQWLYFQVGHIGPMFGQFGHFHLYAKDNCKDNYPFERYRKETQRLLRLLDKQLTTSGFIFGSTMTIADIATAPWVNCLTEFYHAQDILELHQYPHVTQWLNAFLARPEVQKGMLVCQG